MEENDYRESTFTLSSSRPQYFQPYGGYSRLARLMSDCVNYEGGGLLNLNMIDEPTIVPAFDTTWIDNMVMNPYKIDTDVEEIFIILDPSAGRGRNFYALTSMAFINNTCILLGAEAAGCGDTDLVCDIIQKHVNKLREISYFRYALAVIIVENNVPLVADDIRRIVTRRLQLHNTYFMPENNKSSSIQHDIPGCRTLHANKLEMVHIMKEYYMIPKKIAFYSGFVTAQEAESSRCLDIKKEIIKEFRGFSKIKKSRPSPEGAEIMEFFYSGKVNNMDDDYCLCCLIGVYMHKRFVEEVRFSDIRWRSKNNK